MNEVRTPSPANLLLAFFLIALQLTGCAGMQPGYESPSVSVQSFRAVPSDGGTGLPSFEIDLHVTNPNLDPGAMRRKIRVRDSGSISLSAR